MYYMRTVPLNTNENESNALCPYRSVYIIHWDDSSFLHLPRIFHYGQPYTMIPNVVIKVVARKNLIISQTRRLKVENFALIATYSAFYEKITRWNEIKVDKSGMHEHWIDSYPWLLINNTS